MTFFQLLIAADRRLLVSTPRSASTVPEGAAPQSGTASALRVGDPAFGLARPRPGIIDKLQLRLAGPVRVADLEAAAVAAGLAFVKGRLRDKSWGFFVGSKKSGTIVKLGFHHEIATELITRPSAFQTFSEYIEHLHALVGERDAATATITRLDFAVDYDVPLDDLLRGVDVAKKMTKATFTDGGPRTGIQVGKNDERVIIYDRTKRDKAIVGPRSRIEVQLYGKKLPVHRLGALRLSLLNGDAACLTGRLPLRYVRVLDVRLVPPSPFASPREHDRFATLKALVETTGYLSARKLLSEKRNFRRDFGEMIVTTPYATQPTDALVHGMRLFFEVDENALLH